MIRSRHDLYNKVLLQLEPKERYFVRKQIRVQIVLVSAFFLMFGLAIGIAFGLIYGHLHLTGYVKFP